MAMRQILPACADYAADLSAQVQSIEGAGAKCESLRKRLGEILALMEDATGIAERLEAARQKAKAEGEPLAQAKAYRDSVFAAMETLRAPIDRLEKLLPKDAWPMPTYEDLLFKM